VLAFSCCGDRTMGRTVVCLYEQKRRLVPCGLRQQMLLAEIVSLICWIYVINFRAGRDGEE